MPPWNVHDILLRFTNPPVTGADGLLQADRHGVINRWDIVNAIEHAPWTTKQLYAMRAAEKNSRAHQYSAFNGWNNSYSYDPNDRHSITESDLWAKHRGYWYHHDGRPFIPIQKQFDRAIRLGNAVAKPIVSLLRRARSHSALPRGIHKEGNVDNDHDPPDPTPHRRLRRRATISRMSDNFQDDSSDDPRESELGKRPTTRGLTWKRPSSKVHGLACPCWKCDEFRQFMCGRYRIPQDGTYDKNKGTGVDKYSETWDDWNIRTDFARKASRAPFETLDLRRRSRPKEARDAGGHPVASGSRPTHHTQAMPPPTKRSDPPVAPTSRPVPPAPVVPDHVASHHANARLLNEEQQRYAKERADWKAARLQERRELEKSQERQPRGPVDEWRRAVDVPQREEGTRGREHVSRPEQTRAPEQRDVPGRRHRHEAPANTKPEQAPVTAPPRASEAQERRPAPPAIRPAPSAPRPAPRPAPPVIQKPARSAAPVARQSDSHKRHLSLAPDQPWEDDDSDPFDERAFHLAQFREVSRPAPFPADPVSRQDPLPPRAPGRMTRAERDARIAYLARDTPITAEERAQMRQDLSRFANGGARGLEPRGRSRDRPDPRQRHSDNRNNGALAEAELRRREQSAGFSGPTNAEYGYIYGRLQTHLDAQPRPSSHTPAGPPITHAAPGRQPKPARDIGLGRPPAPAPRAGKALPSLPSFPTLASSGDAGPSRDRDQPSRRARATYVQTPPEDTPIRHGRRGSPRTDQTDLGDSISSRNVPRAGDEGWREAWLDAQMAAKKQELKKALEEYEEMAEAKARRESKRR